MFASVGLAPWLFKCNNLAVRWIPRAHLDVLPYSHITNSPLLRFHAADLLENLPLAKQEYMFKIDLPLVRYSHMYYCPRENLVKKDEAVMDLYRQICCLFPKEYKVVRSSLERRHHVNPQDWDTLLIKQLRSG